MFSYLCMPTTCHRITHSPVSQSAIVKCRNHREQNKTFFVCFWRVCEELRWTKNARVEMLWIVNAAYSNRSTVQRLLSIIIMRTRTNWKWNEKKGPWTPTEVHTRYALYGLAMTRCGRMDGVAPLMKHKRASNWWIGFRRLKFRFFSLLPPEVNGL